MVYDFRMNFRHLIDSIFYHKCDNHVNYLLLTGYCLFSIYISFLITDNTSMPNYSIN